MRQLLLAVTVLLFATGLALAADVTLVKYNAETKELTVKDGDADKIFKLTDKTKVTFIDKDGTAKDGTIEAAAKVLGNEKAAGKLKFEITTDKYSVSQLKLKMRRSKN